MPQFKFVLFGVGIAVRQAVAAHHFYIVFVSDGQNGLCCYAHFVCAFGYQLVGAVCKTGTHDHAVGLAVFFKLFFNLLFQPGRVVGKESVACSRNFQVGLSAYAVVINSDIVPELS